jgi:uncharacterized membrane protein YagU involved in acid resistance
MQTSFHARWDIVVRQAIAAGIAGGILIDLYLWITTILPSHGSLAAMYQWVASAAIGPVALSNASYAWVGVVVHFIVSIGWAGGYAYLAQTQRYMNARWYISGFFYGIVVMIFMTLLLLGAHAFVFPATPNDFLNQVLAHCIFFGMPVAFVVARLSNLSPKN